MASTQGGVHELGSTRQAALARGRNLGLALLAAGAAWTITLATEREAAAHGGAGAVASQGSAALQGGAAPSGSTVQAGAVPRGGATGNAAAMLTAGAGGGGAGRIASANQEGGTAGHSQDSSPSKNDTQRAQIPSLLSAMGVLNTVLVFVYSTVLNRVATLARRRYIPWLFLGLVAAMLCLVCAYVFEPRCTAAWTVDHWHYLIDVGLVTWIVCFGLIMIFVRSATVDSVHDAKHLPEQIKFEDRSERPDFGLPVIDNAIRRAVELGRGPSFPLLLIHDIEKPWARSGRELCQAGARRR